MSGSTIPVKRSRSSMILNPPIRQRFGFLFNKQRFMSNNFDITVLLHLERPPDEMATSSAEEPPLDQTFAIWFSTKVDVAAHLKSHTKASLQMKDRPSAYRRSEFYEVLKAADFDSFTVMPRMFSGAAAVISATDWNHKRELTATLVDGIGNTKIEGLRSFPVGDGGSGHLFDDSKKGTGSLKKYALSYMRLKFSVRPDSLVISILDGIEWREIVKKTGTISISNSGGYIGMTSFTGNAVGAPYGIRISSFRVTSFDLQSLAADPSNAAVQMFAREGLLIANLISEDYFGKARDQVDVLLKLEKIIDKFRKDSVQSLSLLNKQVLMFQGSTTKISAEVATLNSEVRTVFKKTGNKSRDMSALVSEVQSIQQVLTTSRNDQEELLRHVKTKKRLLEKTVGAERHVNYLERKIQYQTDELNEVLETHTNTTLILLLIVVGGTLFVGVFFYLKLNAYAKKAHTF